VQQRHQDAAAGRADRVADGDGAAVDVDLAGVPAHFLVDGAGLGGEGFVDLEQVQVGRLPAGALPAPCAAGTGPMPMMDGSRPLVA
jgi:hypothetical protein